MSRKFLSARQESHTIMVFSAILLGGNSRMHQTFMAIALGATVALVFNKTIAGLVNTVLSPLGLTYA